jgi:subtilisin family serine protease
MNTLVTWNQLRKIEEAAQNRFNQPSYPSIVRRWSFAFSLLAILLFSSSAFALLIGDNGGPESVIVQIQDSLLLSNDLDSSLSGLAALEQNDGVNVEKWWAAGKLLQLVSFPQSWTEAQALAAIDDLQASSAVEKVVAVSGFNLDFQPGDFAREYDPSAIIPDAARRGLDAQEWQRPPMTQADIDAEMALPYVPNQVIVRWKSEYVWNMAQTGFRQNTIDFNTSEGAVVVQEMTPSSTDLIQVLAFSGTSIAGKLSDYAASSWVDYVQPNFIYSSNAIPNDPGYTNPGQPNLPRISAPSAWSITTGFQSNVVAVGDTGANVNHPDFVTNLSPGWLNFVAVPPNSNVTDDDIRDPQHGSNVAGIIGAKGNNGQYMTGVAWNVSLLILKVLDSQGSGTAANIAAAINYAYSTGQGHNPAIAMNLSLGSGASSFIDPTLLGAIRLARTHGMVVVAAAGNGNGITNVGIDCEQPGNLISPADAPTDNMIAVGATTSNDTRPNFSNYGRYRVELGAPGGEDPPNNTILGILGLTQNPSDKIPYRRFSGTSQATPHVTGALQLVKSQYPWENYAGIKDRVLMATDDVPALTNLFRTGGRLDLNKALHKRTLIRNLSTRARVESGDRIVIGGFIIGGSGSGTLKVAIRGLGPSLPPLGVPRLPNPMITLNNSSGHAIYTNNDWGTLPQSQKDDLAANGLTPTNSSEAAMVQTLAPGNYTVFLQSYDGQFGVGLFEIYELSGNIDEQTRLKNISTRCKVGTGDEVAIAGTIMGDPAGNPNDPTVPKRRLLMRGIGPSLAQYLIPGVLANPYIELHNSTGALIASNDQWRDVDGTSTGLEDKLTEAGFAPANVNESVLWPTLTQSPGNTTILKGVNNGTGIGLIEFFEY